VKRAYREKSQIYWIPPGFDVSPKGDSIPQMRLHVLPSNCVMPLKISIFKMLSGLAC
jgi:hypothetical protein